MDTETPRLHETRTTIIGHHTGYANTQLTGDMVNVLCIPLFAGALTNNR